MKYCLLLVFLSCLIKEKIYGESLSVCHVCRCENEKTVDCDRLKIPASFEMSAWKDLTNRTILEVNLNNNYIGRVTPFPKLNITKLSLRQNRIMKIDDRAFWNLTKLLELDLGENQLTTRSLTSTIFQGHFSREFYEPLPVRNLDLSGNEIHSLPINIFEHLPEIRRLNLKRNPFKMLDSKTMIAISGLQNIQHLDLSYTEIRELPIGFLHSIKTLEELILEGNFLKQIPSDVLFESHNLIALNLNYNPIPVISAERPFPEMPSLKILELSHIPELTKIENYSMHGLMGLTTFNCKDNEKLEYISPLTFASRENDTSRPNVTDLDLSNNALRYLNKSFLHFEHVKYVNLMGNSWSCDCDNQWLVSELMPTLLKANCPISIVSSVICSEPEPMKGMQLLALHKMNYEMRCLDYYGNQPQNDSVILITVFSIMIAVMVVGLIFVWRMKMNGCRREDRPDYSRAFYRPASSDEKY